MCPSYREMWELVCYTDISTGKMPSPLCLFSKQEDNTKLLIVLSMSCVIAAEYASMAAFCVGRGSTEIRGRGAPAPGRAHGERRHGSLREGLNRYPAARPLKASCVHARRARAAPAVASAKPGCGSRGLAVFTRRAPSGSGRRAHHGCIPGRARRRSCRAAAHLSIGTATQRLCLNS